MKCWSNPQLLIGHARRSVALPVLQSFTCGLSKPLTTISEIQSAPGAWNPEDLGSSLAFCPISDSAKDKTWPHALTSLGPRWRSTPKQSSAKPTRRTLKLRMFEGQSPWSAHSQSCAQAKTEIFKFSEMFYNPVKRRRHSRGISPMSCEKQPFFQTKNV